MKRLGALVLALGLIGGAIAVNRAIHGTDSADDGTDGASGAKLRVVCATEFSAACDALATDTTIAEVATFTTQAPGATVDALVTDPSPTFDLWLTSAPWPAIATARAQAADRPTARVAQASSPLASSALSAVARSATAASITSTCTPFSATCLLTGTSTIGLRPTTETAGMLAVGAFIATWPGLEDPDIVAIDTDDAFRSAFSNTKARARFDSGPVRTILTQPKFAVALDLDAEGQLAAASNRAQFTAMPTSVSAVAVAVPAATSTGRGALDRIGRRAVVSALTDLGWSTKIPDDDGLPEPAVLDQLVSRWNTR